MKISILGCGWLGLLLGKELINSGYTVLGSTTQENKLQTLRDVGIEPHLIQLSSEHKISSSSFFDSDVLVIAIPPNRKSGKTDEYLLQLTQLLEKLRSGLTRKLVFISSTSVYPETNSIVTEQDAASDNYMVRAENLVRQGPFQTTVIRMGGLFGPARHPGRFLAGKINVSGGDAPVNMIHRDDAVAIVIQIIKEQIWDEVFSACADEHPTRVEFYARMARNAGLVPPSFTTNEKRLFKIVSSQKLKERLRYQFIVPNPADWNE